MQNPRSEARVWRGERKSGELSGHYSGIWENTKNSGKVPKISNLESFPKIIKNNKYYKMIFGEIGFQKFNAIFKNKNPEVNRQSRYTPDWPDFDKF